MRIRPRPALCMCGATSRHMRKVPPVFTSKHFCQVAQSGSTTVESATIPALFTSTSIVPWRSTTASTARCTDSGAATSQTTWSTVGAPSAGSSGKARSSATTREPSSAKRAAMAAPIPRAAPVTTTTLSRRSSSIALSSPAAPVPRSVCGPSAALNSHTIG